MYILLLIIASLLHASQQTEEEVLKVSIYYEALCPDSVKFIKRQLYPAYAKIGSSLQLDFVPYGKAMHDFVNGKWEFTCQHGLSECLGNKYQACGLSKNQTQLQKLEFVYCVMSAPDPSSKNTIAKCAPKLEVPVDEIFACAESSEGDEILAKMGDQTQAITPNVYFIPTIIFNDVYNYDAHWDSITNFFSTACCIFDNKPNGCK